MMDTHTDREMADALRAIAAMIDRGEQAQAKFAPGTAQHTLQKNRLHALRVASALITAARAGGDATGGYTATDLQSALAPLASLTSKSEKALGKLTPGTWQHRMLTENLRALHIASPLLARATGAQ